MKKQSPIFVACMLLCVSADIFELKHRRVETRWKWSDVSLGQCVLACRLTPNCTAVIYRAGRCAAGLPDGATEESHQAWVLTHKDHDVVKGPDQPYLLMAGPSNSSCLRLMDPDNFTLHDIPQTAGFVGAITYNHLQNLIYASYWPPKIDSFAVDGSHKRRIANIFTTDMAIDPHERRLFYVASDKNELASIMLDGTGRRTILSNVSLHAIDLDVDKRFIYCKDTEDVWSIDYQGGKRHHWGSFQESRAFHINREEKRWYIGNNYLIGYKPVKYKLQKGQNSFENTNVLDLRDCRVLDDLLVFRHNLYFIKRMNNDKTYIGKYRTSGRRVEEREIPVDEGGGSGRFILAMLF